LEWISKPLNNAAQEDTTGDFSTAEQWGMGSEGLCEGNNYRDKRVKGKAAGPFQEIFFDNANASW
jgi:hypothetical protein